MLLLLCCTMYNAHSHQQEAHTIFLSKKKRSYQNLVIREVAQLASAPTEQRQMPTAAILYISPPHCQSTAHLPHHANRLAAPACKKA